MLKNYEYIISFSVSCDSYYPSGTVAGRSLFWTEFESSQKALSPSNLLTKGSGSSLRIITWLSRLCRWEIRWNAVVHARDFGHVHIMCNSKSVLSLNYLREKVVSSGTSHALL